MDGSSPRPPPAWALVLVWALIPATEGWLHLAAATPVAAGALALEALLFVAVGLCVSQLPSFPLLRSPVWALAAPLLLAGLRGLGVSLTAGLQAVGLVWVVGGPALWLARRGTVRWWWAALGVPPLVTAVHVRATLGADATQPALVLDRLAHDLWGPIRPGLPAATHTGPPVILITVDTLRADVARTMASHARLADGGAVWRAAQSTSSWTLPALASTLTGLPAANHGATCLADGHCQGLHPEVSTLAQRLREAGYVTVGINSNPWSGRHNGFDRGFDRFEDLGVDGAGPLLVLGERGRAHHQDASAVVDRALHALDELPAEGGFFVWLHLFDPHMPYLNATDPTLRTVDAVALRSAQRLSVERREAIRAAYRAEVAHADAHLMRLLDALAQRGGTERAVVALTSDHGEEFWEHGQVEHGHSHHAEVVEVPLVIRGPGVQPGARRGTASLVDVTPTLLAAAGVGATGTLGRDLRTPLPSDRVATVYGALRQLPLCSAVGARHRAIVTRCGEEGQRLSAYDRLADPGEHHRVELSEADPVRRAALGVQEPDRREDGARVTSALEALGYVQ
ncbi:MAG: sulfatase [Myxococcales bacterium]|nr:sulfatase [Myxococcales bacterium]